MLGEPNLWAEQSFSIGAYKSWPSPCYIFMDYSNLLKIPQIWEIMMMKFTLLLLILKGDRKAGGLFEEDDVEAIHWD